MIRKKPDFYRQGWYKFHRLGKKVKKRRKWRHPTGGDSKTRLKVRGKAARPTIGWGADKSEFGKIQGFVPIRVENLTQLENVKKTEAIIIARVGRKNRMAIIAKANERGIKILNKYMEKKNATK
jgi:large subunit ribosomal protein L32e